MRKTLQADEFALWEFVRRSCTNSHAYLGHYFIQLEEHRDHYLATHCTSQAQTCTHLTLPWLRALVFVWPPLTYSIFCLFLCSYAISSRLCLPALIWTFLDSVFTRLCLPVHVYICLGLLALVFTHLGLPAFVCIHLSLSGLAYICSDSSTVTCTCLGSFELVYIRLCFLVFVLTHLHSPLLTWTYFIQLSTPADGNASFAPAPMLPSSCKAEHAHTVIELRNLNRLLYLPPSQVPSIYRQ